MTHQLFDLRLLRALISRNFALRLTDANGQPQSSLDPRTTTLSFSLEARPPKAFVSKQPTSLLTIDRSPEATSPETYISIPLDTLTNYVTSKTPEGYHRLATILLSLNEPEADHSKYMQHCLEMKFASLTFIEKTDMIRFMVENVESEKIETLSAQQCFVPPEKVMALGHSRNSRKRQPSQSNGDTGATETGSAGENATKRHRAEADTEMGRPSGISNGLKNSAASLPVSQETREREASFQFKINTSECQNDLLNVEAISARQFVVRTRTTHLSQSSTKSFESLRRRAFELFQSSVAGSSKEKHGPGSANQSNGQRSYSRVDGKRGSASMIQNIPRGRLTSKPPIVLVPAAATSLITIYNIKSFLEEGIFVTSKAAREKHQEDGGGPRPTMVSVKRNAKSYGNRQNSRFRGVVVMDSAENFKDEDWLRVVAVFATGATWQFSGWKYDKPVDLFTKVKGYHLKYHDEESKPLVKTWKVSVLDVNRHKRHMDGPLIINFWNELDKWIVANKPYLLDR